MADDEVKWEATSSGQTTLFFIFLNLLQDFTSQFPPPKNQIVYSCHFLSLCWVHVNLRMESRITILIPEWNQDVRWSL